MGSSSNCCKPKYETSTSVETSYKYASRKDSKTVR